MIPARNEERYVERALASVATQTFPIEAMEVIVVDNGSTDRTSAVVDAFAARTPRLAIRTVPEPRLGIARAKDRGAREARGAVIVFLDADSCATPTLAEAAMREVSGGSPAGSIRIAADSRDVLDRGFFGLLEWGKGLFQIRAQMFYCERALYFEVGGFDLALHLAEDREFLARLQRRGVSVCHIRDAAILTSPRRLHALPFRLGLVTTLVRWSLAHAGIGRRWRY